MRIGIDVSGWPVAVNPSRPDRWPSWKIHTIAPNVADSDSRLSTIAVAGTSRLPNTRNSSTNVVTVVLMDLRMPVLDGIAATRELAGDDRAGRVLSASAP